MGTQGTNAHHPVSLQLDARFCRGCSDAHQLFVPAARGKYQEGGVGRLPEGAQSPSQAALAGDLGRCQNSPQSLRARLPRQFGWAYTNCLLAALCARSQSSRIFVGLAQETRDGQLLPQQPQRAASEGTQQAQERTKATHDHRSMLCAGKLVVMS